jgi:hypothetical protein
MLSVDKTPYVGRFARDWHRLATTNHPQPSNDSRRQRGSSDWSHQENHTEPHAQDERGDGREHSTKPPGRLPFESQGTAVMGDEHLT